MTVPFSIRLIVSALQTIHVDEFQLHSTTRDAARPCPATCSAALVASPPCNRSVLLGASITSLVD